MMFSAVSCHYSKVPEKINSQRLFTYLVLGTAELLLHLESLSWLRFDLEVSFYDWFAPLFEASWKAAYHGSKCLVEEHC